MRDQPSVGKVGLIVGWSVGLSVLLALAAFWLKSHNGAIRIEDVVGNLTRKNHVLSQMKADLLRSVEAEKSAVLSESDEESEAFADQSLQAIAAVEANRIEFGKLIEISKNDDEMKTFHEFNRCWTEFQKTEQIVLDLAVQNTNIKASRLSQTEARDDVQRFVHDLSELVVMDAVSGNCRQMVLPIFEAVTSCLHIHYLHTPHIKAASDGEMDQIEAEMKNDKGVVELSLDVLTERAGERGRAALQDARKAYADFIQVTEEVVRLSRQNTNVKSLELSLGKKRAITAECEGILTDLQEVVQSKTFKATR
jgi:hypothetical protein